MDLNNVQLTLETSSETIEEGVPVSVSVLAAVVNGTTNLHKTLFTPAKSTAIPHDSAMSTGLMTVSLQVCKPRLAE